MPRKGRTKTFRGIALHHTWGKGVRAMPSHTKASSAVDQAIPLSLVDVSPSNPRTDLPEVDALAENIRQWGLLQPITVRSLGDRYELIGGHRRRAAYLLLRDSEPDNPDWQRIPAVIRSADDDDAFMMLLSSQLHTRNWRPREEAAALERLAQQGLSLKEIGQRVQRTESWTSKRLRVYADSVLSGCVQTGKLQVAVAEELLTVQDVRLKKRLADQAVKGNWSKEDARRHNRALRADFQVGELERLTRNLTQALSTIDPVHVPLDLMRDLQTLRGRVETLASQREPQTTGRRSKK